MIGTTLEPSTNSCAFLLYSKNCCIEFLGISCFLPFLNSDQCFSSISIHASLVDWLRIKKERNGVFVSKSIFLLYSANALSLLICGFVVFTLKIYLEKNINNDLSALARCKNYQNLFPVWNFRENLIATFFFVFYFFILHTMHLHTCQLVHIHMQIYTFIY